MNGANQQAKLPMSHTLWSPADTVRDAAESLGITTLGDEVAKNLAMDVEYRVHEILDQAIKFMRHGKRRTLTVSDVDRAMKVLNLEPLYGYDVSRPLVFKEAIVGPGQNLYYVHDDEVDFEKLINQPLPKVPRYTTFTAHWLAIEGVQPTIPQNPTPAEVRSVPALQKASTDNILAIDGGASGSDPTARASSAKKDMEIKPLVKHMLSKELQLYFDKAITALLDDTDESLKNAALDSIRSDPGLHQLVPYFIQFVAETLTHNLKNINLLTTMLLVIYSLLMNKSIFLDPYIHALMPCILTLLLAKKIGPQGTSENEEEAKQHFQLRDLAASLLERIINNYGSSYSTLKPRITRTLLRAFLSSSTITSVGTQYGTIKGIKCLGPEVIRVVMIGNLKNWSKNVLSGESFSADTANRELLISNVIDCLRILKSDGELTEPSTKRLRVDTDQDVDMDGESETLTEEMSAKLTERVGDILATEISKQDDSVAIYKGIFFGES
ncbi:unnamed protein product [Kuraishia capsulata CBS 1993]|uniref:TBP-associated factor 6 n=1 Tax=Kuraishia capsulata CBS 1993 TaxID=1382522 RepID=W6MFW5_9ASCO|nr:uncharacterized protein KUCA_T00000496001 [Kuraishia capsulata CBS 1993]CDK24531.1 unnamed protein product [Kuraishia capsulata CBS 1993]